MSATTAVLRTESRLFVREPMAAFWLILFPVVLLCILGAIPGFRESSADLGGRSVVDLYVGVTVLLSMVLAGIQTMPQVLISYRERKVLRRLRTTPVSPFSLLLAQVLVHVAAVAISSVLVLAVGRVVFGTPLPASPAGYLLGYVLAVVVSFAIGAVITAVSSNSRIGAVVGMLFFFPAMFTAGVYIPVQGMGGTLRDVVGLTPHGAASEALASATIGSFPAAEDLAVMAAWTAVLALVAVRSFRWE